MGRFVTINLASVPPPDIVETLSFEAIRAAIIADGVARMNAAGIVYDTNALESEPFVYLCEAYAAREVALRARVNDACKAVLLPSSWGTNLDNIGTAFDTARNTGEADSAYAQRIYMAPNAFSSAGPTGAYEYWANTIVPGLLDVSAVMVAPGKVQVTLLAPGPTYLPTAQQIQTLAAFFMNADAKPLTDYVVVAAPTLTPVTIAGTLTLYPGPDQTVVLASATSALATMLAANQKLGYTLARSAIMSALQQPGVESVALASPAADVAVPPTGVWVVTAQTIGVAQARST